MINRVLIRIKIVQILYSFSLKEDKNMDVAEKELLFSLAKAYELYYYLLMLMVELTETQRLRLDSAKNKLLVSEEDRNPNMRFVDNRFIAQLKTNLQYNEYTNQQKISWVNESAFIRLLLDKILNSDIYVQYIASADDSYDADREFWKKIFKSFIATNDDLQELLETQSLYWNDDLEIVSTFVLKTIKKFDEKNGVDQPLLPMFKDSEDERFAKLLLRYAVLGTDENKTDIDRHTRNWEIDRVAHMDIVVMLVALAEIRNFPEIPVKVTLNEYIEIAKAYSTNKSGHFINGVLDSIVAELKKEGKLTK